MSAQLMPSFGLLVSRMVKIAAGASNNRTERDPMRTLRLIGAAAAFLAVLGIAILVLWAAIRLPRF
jgi:hypothetical protein